MDNDYCFAPDSEAKLTTSPDEVYSEVVLTYNRGTKRLFRRRPSTATKYIARGTTFDRPYVGTFATASTQATDFLNRHSNEQDRITVTLPQVPRTRVGLVRAGQRIDVKFTHIAGYEYWTSMRVVSCKPVPIDDLARVLLDRRWSSCRRSRERAGRAVWAFVAARSRAGR